MRKAFVCALVFVGLFSFGCEDDGPAKLLLKSNHQVLSLEVAAKSAEWQKGLMNRESLAALEGMIFLGTEERYRSFWMKNTYIPLDIIFLDKDFKIVHIAKNTTPLSEASISSLAPAQYIVELNAGSADDLAWKVGDQLQKPEGMSDFKSEVR